MFDPKAALCLRLRTDDNLGRVAVACDRDFFCEELIPRFDSQVVQQFQQIAADFMENQGRFRIKMERSSEARN